MQEEMSMEQARERAELEMTADGLGIYFREVGRVRMLRPEEEGPLARKAAQGDLGARNRFLEANLRLVVAEARDHLGQGVPMADLIQEGTLGMIRALEKFNPDRGTKFSTYATPWIRQYMARYIGNQGRTIRVPSHINELNIRLNVAQRRLTVLLGREPSEVELAKEAGISLEKLRWAREAAVEVVSLDTPVGDSEEAALGAFIPDTNAPGPYEACARRTQWEVLRHSLSQLSEREAGVIRLRFGLEDGERHTLDEVGERYGVTRERVRQLEHQALKKLRSPANLRAMQDLLD